MIENSLFMDKQRLKRAVFFWVDKLQITRKERISFTILMSLVVVLSLLNVVIKKKVVPTPENHAEILAEFERRSALIEREDMELDQRYAGVISEESEEESSITAMEPININEASTVELTSLPGIGETYAQRIIEYRETNGDFTSVDELVNVRGIGERTLEKIKPFIKL